MYYIFLIFSLVNFAIAVSEIELLFETKNKCGCYYFEKCPDLLKPNCSAEDNNFEELYQQNSASTENPELCREWFLEGFKKQLIFTGNGTLSISILFSSMINQKVTYTVHLRYQNQCLDSYDSSPFFLLNMKHSTKYVQIQRNSLDLCRKTIGVTFPFIFTGCYQLYINSGIKNTLIDGCTSKPFFVNTSYKKTPLDNFEMVDHNSYVAQNEDLKLALHNEMLSEPKSILISLIDSEDYVMKEVHLTSEQRGNCCHGLVIPRGDQSYNMEYCPCKWKHYNQIDCLFTQIKIGNYTVIVRFIDSRCDENSLWIEKGCSWHFDIEANGQITPIESVPQEINNSYLMVILYCLLAFGIIAIAGIMLAVYYLKESKKKNRTLVFENIVENTHLTNEDEEILLLYPRDCDKFMIAMTLFRALLKASCRREVHDAWNEEIYDKVAESIETWSLPLIQNNSTKIIVVLTECSKVIEDSYIGDNQFATYRDPKPFDKVFAQSIKALNEYFATRFDSYRRVFVVRLDEKPVIDFSFNFNRATVYILPHGLQTLVDDLNNENFTTLNKGILENFTVAIQEYQAYKQQHKEYLQDILNIKKQF